MNHLASTAIDSVIRELGAAGARLTELGACEGAAGNISVFLGDEPASDARFSLRDRYALPTSIPMPRSGILVVTGSGVRLREIGDDPGGTLGLLLVTQGSTDATLCTAPNRRFARLTSELNSHLALHTDALDRSETTFHAVVHAQPRRLTYLSHISEYQDSHRLSRRLLRWQPETILNLPHGIGFVSFHVPGSEELMRNTVTEMRRRTLVVWARHGVVACSERSSMHALDLIEYAEAAADYECSNLALAERSSGLSESELRQIAAAWQVEQSVV